MAAPKKKPSLAEQLRPRPVAVAPAPPAPPPAGHNRPPKGRAKGRRGSADDGRIGQTLRLQPEAWEQLRVMAARERLNAHDLLVEAVNDLFAKRGLPPLARLPDQDAGG